MKSGIETRKNYFRGEENWFAGDLKIWKLNLQIEY